MFYPCDEPPKMRLLLKTCNLMRSVKTRDLVVAVNGVRSKPPVLVQFAIPTVLDAVCVILMLNRL